MLILLLPAARRGLTPRTWLVGLAYATTLVLFVTANKLTTAVNTIFLQSTAPIYLLWLGPWLLREPVRRRDLGFTAVMFGGMLLFFVGVEPVRVTAPQPVLGNWLAVISGLAWAFTILGLRWLGRDASGPARPAESAVIAGNLLACLGCLPMALPVAGGTSTDWLLIGYLGIFQIGIAYMCVTRSVRGLPALEVSLLLLIEPVLNGIIAWWIHGETPGPWALVGCTVILGSTLWRSLSRG
jgi:drug/metabolite transporter (DMT)-like permease